MPRRGHVSRLRGRARSFVSDPGLSREESEEPGRYREVLRNRAFLGSRRPERVYVAAGYAQLEVLPVFAKNEAGVTERQIGFIFFVNTLAIVLAQFPDRDSEGRRRMPALALMTFIWTVTWLVVFAGGVWVEGGRRGPGLRAGGPIFGLGECFHGPTQGALVADLAPPRLRGRYMALSTLSWEIGFVIGPTAAGFILTRHRTRCGPSRRSPASSPVAVRFCSRSGSRPSYASLLHRPEAAATGGLDPDRRPPRPSSARVAFAGNSPLR